MKNSLYLRGRPQAETRSRGKAGGVATTFYWKAFTLRSFLTHGNLENFIWSQECGKWVDVLCGYVRYSIFAIGARERGLMARFAYSAWGLCKFARSTIPGNTRASDCGTGNRIGSHAFFIANLLTANAGSPAAHITDYESFFIRVSCKTRLKC